MARHGYLREFDEEYDREKDRDRDRERSWIDRRDTDSDWRRDERGRGFMLGESDEENRRGYGREHGYGEYAQGRRSFSANPDDHYRSWRDKQMQALDRDYEEYCREREQQFHQNFDSWRRDRIQGRRNRTDELLLNRPAARMTTAPVQEGSEPIDPDSTAGMGQAEPEATTPTAGRGRR